MELGPDGGVVMTVLSLVGSSDSIVLLDPERRPPGVLHWHPFANVLRVTASGEIVWRGDLLRQETTAKCWIGVAWVGPRLRAWTYSYECELDPATGRIVRSHFTK